MTSALSSIAFSCIYWSERGVERRMMSLGAGVEKESIHDNSDPNNLYHRSQLFPERKVSVGSYVCSTFF
jgi:hypothetical protein